MLSGTSQGLFEYRLILVFIALAVNVVFTQFGRALGTAVWVFPALG